jgi:hypothetical protein
VKRGSQLGVFFVLLAACSFAAPITITHTGVGSGTIGGTTFTGASFTITDIGDTASRSTFPGGFFIDDLSASIAINGVGTFSFITGTRTFVNQVQIQVGFSRAGINGIDLYDGPTTAAFGTWDMLSSIGPISGSAVLSQWGAAFGTVNTSGGVLVFNNSTSDTVFKATVGSVPEPGTLALLGIGIIVLSLIRPRLTTNRTATNPICVRCRVVQSRATEPEAPSTLRQRS